MTRALASLALVLAASCTAPPPFPVAPRELTPVPDSLAHDDPLYAPQPHRDRPTAIVLDAARGRLWVALAGTESAPSREVAVVDATTLAVLGRVEVGPFPVALAMHPDGRHLVVLARFARYASVIDVEREAVVGEVPTPYYSEAIAFDASGTRAYVANRWRDALLRWDVHADGDRFDVRTEDDGTSPAFVAGIRTLANPRRVLVAAGGARVLVTSESALGVAAYDAATGAELARHSPNAPVTDAALVGAFVVVLHTGSGSGHPPDVGRDGDRDGLPGDGTANVVFQDLQNEIDVLAADDLHLLHRYTSDSIAFRDFRDVDPDVPDAGLALPAPDTWPPSRAAFLPPRETWIVAGAMPERVVPFTRGGGGDAIAVVFGGSSEVQTFDVDPSTGALAPRETAGGLYATGMGAIDGVVVGRRLVVVARLGEELTSVDLDAPPAPPMRAFVGDVSGGPFPSTDAELGEAFNTMTALFGVDGDQTCVHCHRDGSPIGKDVSMPLLADPVNGTRLVMSYRGASDTRPWFFEGAMDEGNFFPVINEFARRENFCCEQTDTRVWAALPSRAACDADPTVEGCHHVLACEDDPPPACATRRYGSPYLTRDAHFRAAATRVFGRDTTFGDALYSEHVGVDGGIERRPLALGFDGITRALGLFLRARSRLLPSPSAALPRADVRLGAALFASSDVGCSGCHPLPTAAIAVGANVSAPLAMPPVVTPLRDASGRDVDRVTAGFLRTFPLARQDDAGLRIGVTSLRGAWDRVRFLHHGAARSVREVIATPGHPALRAGEVGHDERDGLPDTHGGTSQLSADELDALAAYVDTL